MLTLDAERLHRLGLARRCLARAAVSCLLLATLTGCATNPVTGRREFVLMSESQEIAMGQSYAPQIASSMGLYDDEELTAYVESVGMPMARSSERPELPWQFRVVDDGAVNAFAVPGGFIYVTRGILAHMGSEAELASVLGHEIGHVTARHSVNQLSKQQLAGLGLGLGAIALGDQAGALLPAASAGMQLFFLKYGRDHERQSDQLGLRYMTRAGYEPDEMVSMFRTLSRSSRAAGGSRIPEWLSTHPSPENREQRTAEAISQLRAEGGLIANTVERDSFLEQIDGLAYGADPRQGFFAGSGFHHPELRFQLHFPPGWQTANQTQAVLAASPEQDAVVQLTLVAGASADEAARAFFSQQGLVAERVGTTSVNGLAGVVGRFGVKAQQGVIEGLALFVEHRGLVYQILGYASQAGFGTHSGAIANALASFADQTDPRVLDVQPQRLQIVRPAHELSLAEFARQYPGPASAEELALINQLDAGQRVAAGAAVKRVVGETLPKETDLR